MASTKNRAKTDKLKVSRATYWAGSSFQNDPQTCENRVAMIEKYKLVKFIDSQRPREDGQLYDHCETYKCEDGTFLMVVSPYKDSSPGLIEKGYVQIPSVYHHELTTSYVKVFKTKKERNV